MLRDGAVVEVSQGRIVYVGQPEDAPRRPDRTVRLGGLAMPGLVNTHAHTPIPTAHQTTPQHNASHHLTSSHLTSDHIRSHV